MNIVELSVETPSILTADESGEWLDIDMYVDADLTEELDLFSQFSLSSFVDDVGEGKGVYIKTSVGPVCWYPFLNGRIDTFLGEQGPGTTDLSIPLITKIDQMIYVLVQDGASGNSMIEVPESQFVVSKVLEEMVNIIFADESTEDFSKYYAALNLTK